MLFLWWIGQGNYGINQIWLLCSNVDVFCHAFKNKSSALKLAKLPKMHPRTKHIINCYHHFREVRQGEKKLHTISTKDQVADMFTKPLPQNHFENIAKLCMEYDAPCHKLAHHLKKIYIFLFSSIISLFPSLSQSEKECEIADIYRDSTRECIITFTQTCSVFWRSVG